MNKDEEQIEQLPKGKAEKVLLQRIREARAAARGLTVYRGLLEDKTVAEFAALVEMLADDGARQQAMPLYDAYHSFINRLIRQGTPGSWRDPWQRRLVYAVLLDENPFSREAERTAYQDLNPTLKKAVGHDLCCLQRLCALDTKLLRQAVIRRLKAADCELPNQLLPIDCSSLVFSDSGDLEISWRLLTSKDWSREMASLAGHYFNRGTGEFTRYFAFRWESRSGAGRLRGIEHPDPIKLEQLVEYQAQKQQLIENTRYFLAKLPASNVLLYGKRGTGKSSMVKGLLNRYSSQGLRLVEVAKENLVDLPEIIGRLRQRAFRFILFIDDLSFEEYEVEYKGLKAVLEGGVESLPENVLVYATSNRRHLVREFFQDRERDEEIHRDDTVQEKLSFADRFGVNIFFPAPSQQVYLQIVEGMARERGLDIGPEELHQKALEWERWHNGVSGRTARQFVDHLTAELLYTED
ncbi:MAG: ATP-binding protein [Firmicutes bacterium]|nr:ATP-binding protein [Bacillota bacterium]